MATFQNADELYKVIGGFFGVLGGDPNIGKKLLDSKLKIRFNYKEPDASIAIDLSGDGVKVMCGAPEFKPEVEMSMKADTAHKFWQGNVNLVVALARREITAKGPIPKILKLLPIIKPSYAMYRPYLEKIGFAASS
jgi:hypothetical protein